MTYTTVDRHLMLDEMKDFSQKELWDRIKKELLIENYDEWFVRDMWRLFMRNHLREKVTVHK